MEQEEPLLVYERYSIKRLFSQKQYEYKRLFEVD